MTLRRRGKTHDSGSTYAVADIASVMLRVADSHEYLSGVSLGKGNLEEDT